MIGNFCYNLYNVFIQLVQAAITNVPFIVVKCRAFFECLGTFSLAGNLIFSKEINGKKTGTQFWSQPPTVLRAAVGVVPNPFGG